VTEGWLRQALVGTEIVAATGCAHRAVAVVTVAAVQRNVGARGDVGLPSFDGRIHGRLAQIWSVQQRMAAGWRHGGLVSLPKLWVVG
jgi:hypothetical protein